MKINTLSLFDGSGGIWLGMTRAGKELGHCFSSETDPYSSSVVRLNFPNVTHLGDVNKINFNELPIIHFLSAGFPCQDLSFAKGNGKGLKGERSGLFYKLIEAIEVLKKKNPDLKFLVENVKMKKEWKDIISDLLGVQPIFINSADFSAQNRQRLYWTNIPVDEWIPCEDKLQDVLETEEDWYVNRDKAYTMTATYSGACPRDYFEKSSRQLAFTDREKSHCIDANYFKGGNLKSYFEKHRRQLVFIDKNMLVQWRKLTCLEVERLQTVPDRYTKCGQKENGDIVEISNTQRYKMLGNGFTINVIAHIIKNL